MTTSVTTTVIDQSSDAGFRAWIAEFISMLTTAGLVQTSDTGQINTTTVTRPATNTSAGYAIFQMNDSQQSAAPILIRFNFGSGSAITTPLITCQVGTATNGAGTLSGGDSATTYTICNVPPGNTTTACNSYACAVDGCFWISWKNNGSGTTGGLPMAMFFLARYTDSTGAPTSGGYSTLFSSNTTSLSQGRSFNFSTSTAFAASTLASMGAQSAWARTTSLVSGVPQVYQMNYITPRVLPHNFAGCVLSAEVGLGVQYQATMTGSTTRNYLDSALTGISGTGLGMIWE